MASQPSYSGNSVTWLPNGDGSYTGVGRFGTPTSTISDTSTSSDAASSVEGTVEGTTEQKAASASSTEAKKQTNNASNKSGAGMAGSILHAKGGVADTATGALEGKSKKAKTLG